MFDIKHDSAHRVLLIGRFDAAQTETARELLSTIEESCTLDFAGLDYISSAGLGVLLATQKRLGGAGHGLTLVNLNPHTRDIFRIAGLDMIFTIE
ncbi:MAG: STAS domain-containing protein [Candidatus Latescibacterota bacterium]